MKKVKKLLSTLLAVTVTAVMCAFPAMAAGTHTLTINSKDTGHIYQAYQVFAGTYDQPSGRLSDITWGAGVKGDSLLSALKTDATLGTLFASSTDAASAAEVLAKNATIASSFADVVSKNLSTVFTTSTENGKVSTISNLSDGYYFVQEDTGKEVKSFSKYILQVIGDQTVNAKTDSPELHKQILHNEKNTYGTVGDNQIGDEVFYRMTSTVPNTTYFKAYVYTIHDKMTAGLTFRDAKIYTDENKQNALDVSYYTVSANPADGDTFDLSVDMLRAVKDGKLSAGQTLYTYYSATLNESAKVYTDGHNDNTAYLEYSNNPNDDKTTTKTPKETVYDWTFTIGVNKIDGATKAALTGAEFILNKSADDSTNGISLIENNDGTYTIAPEGYAGTKTITIKAGSVTIKGLDDSVDYYLHETKAPAGYNTLKNPVKINVSAEYNDVGDQLLTGYPKVSINGAEASSTMSTNVENNTGSLLPGTGGIGVTIFYVVGGLLLAGAIVLLVTKKKASHNK